MESDCMYQLAQSFLIIIDHLDNSIMFSAATGIAALPHLHEPTECSSYHVTIVD